MKRQNRRPVPRARQSPAALERLHPHAAGIDCGSAMHYVAVPADRGVGFHDHQRLLPSRPKTDERDPEGAIERRESGPAMAPRVHLQLLAKC